jgi:hypothetical protein
MTTATPEAELRAAVAISFDRTATITAGNPAARSWPPP